MKKHLLITALIVFFLNSCTIEKRIYRPGYYVQWRGHSKEMPIQLQKDNKEEMFSLKRKPLEGNLLALISKPKEEEFNFSEVPKEKLILEPQQKHKSNVYNDDHYTKSVSDNFTAKTINSFRTKKQNENESGDSLIYLTAALMALTTLGLIRTNRKGVTKLTRWAKANPKKTQALIAGMQLPLVALAFYSGHNLKGLGYDLSDTSTYIFGALTALGFLSVPFWAKRNAITIPKLVNRQRLGYLGITLSSLMMMTSFGNHFVDKYPDTLVASTVNTIDHSVFPSHETHKVDDSNNYIAKELNHSQRKAAAGMSLAAAIILIFLLCIVVCAGLCLAGFGVAAIVAGGTPVLGLLGILGIGLGALIFWGGIKGIQNVSRKRKETKSMKR